MIEQIFGVDLTTLIQTIGYLGVAFIIFAESGLLVGFFLPGDSLLFTAGFLASQGFFSISVLALVCFISAVIGDSFGYYFGKQVGPAIFKREDSVFFHKKNLAIAQEYYERHGAKTIIMARFVPVVRTFAPIIAGVGSMKYRIFLINNLIGALIWAVGVSLLGYFLGQAIPNADKFLLPIILVIIFVSILPGLWTVYREWRKRKNNSHEQNS